MKCLSRMLALCALLAAPQMASALSVPVNTHRVLVKAGDSYDGIKYPAGTEVDLVDGSHSVVSLVLSKSFRMNGHVIKAGTRLAVREGKLNCYWSLAGQTVNGIVLKEGAQVCFNEDGGLDMMHLKHPTAIQGNPFAAGTWVHFHSGGKVMKGELARNVTRQGLALASGSTITFYPSGVVEAAVIEQGAHLGKLALEKGNNVESDVSFWPNGKLKAATLVQAARIGRAHCARGAIAFDRSGALRSCDLLKSRQQLAAAAAQQRLSTLADAALLRPSVKVPGVVSLIAGSLAIDKPHPAKLAGTVKQAIIDGSGAAARFDQPVAMAADRAGNLFLTEAGTNRLVRKISPGGLVTTVSGMAGEAGQGYRNGAASAARFASPAGIAIDKQGNLYIADSANNAIRMISTTGVVSTFAGEAPPDSVLPRQRSALQSPASITFDRAGNLYVLHAAGWSLHKVDARGAVATLIDDTNRGHLKDGSLQSAGFDAIDTMAFDTAGNLFIGDAKLLRKIDQAGRVSTLGNYADSFPATAYTPEVLLIDPAGKLYFAANATIRTLAPDGVLSTVAGVAGRTGNQLGVMGVLDHPRSLVMLGPKQFAFISGNAVLRLTLP